jgi:uncharacterized protein with ParB-like and HNH nuclease domain
MDAQPTTISDILPGEKQYFVPVFQRDYSWTRTNWRMLWDDASQLLEAADQVKHFIGPIVILAYAYPYDITRFLVIDGQQRLITLTMLLCALRDFANMQDRTPLANAIQANYLAFISPKGETTHKLIPRSRDRQNFVNIIDENWNELDEESPLTRAYRFFSEQIEGVYNQPLEEEDVLIDIYEMVTKRLQLVTITLNDQDDPSNIFESLNFKVEKLSDSDLIRNYMFMQLDVQDQEGFNNTIWQPLEDIFVDSQTNILNTKILTDFYYRFLTMKEGYFTRKTLYSRFSKWLQNEIKIKTQNGSQRSTLHALSEIVQEIRRFARYYLTIITANIDDPELEQAFNRFSYLGV